MQKVLVLVLATISLVPILSDTARVSLISFSAQISPSTAEDPLTDLPWEVSVSSSGRPASANGELTLAPEDVPYTHESNFILVDPTTGEPIVLPFVLDVPNTGDVNTNGIPDFFDRDVATEGERTFGAHPTPDEEGAELSATWNRSAGDVAGTVRINLQFLGLVSTHDFTIPTYEGLFTYGRINQIIAGMVTLTNVLAANNTISGPWSVTITNNNRLGFDAGTWSGTADVTYKFEPIDSLDRTGTNYIALAGIEDGFPVTSEADYQIWFLVVHSSDANTNNVLDFVESGAVVPERARLEVAKTTNGIEITVRGTNGKSYVLEGTTSLSALQWTTIQTVQMTNSKSSVALQPDGLARFFRVRDED